MLASAAECAPPCSNGFAGSIPARPFFSSKKPGLLEFTLTVLASYFFPDQPGEDGPKPRNAWRVSGVFSYSQRGESLVLTQEALCPSVLPVPVQEDGALED
jgi:hypothetical protein